MSDVAVPAKPDQPDGRKSRPMARRVIRWIFVSQIIMAGILVGRDLAGAGFSSLAWPGTGAPRISEPVRPGDQTRRFSPGRLPARPSTTPVDRPYPETGELPDRLEFATVGSGTDAALSLTGTIAVGDAIRFADHLQTLRSPPNRIWLRSPGGSVSDALAIGRAVRDAGINTAMGAVDICLSACPYVLAAGVERAVHPDAWVGVHQHYFGENTILPAFMAVEDVQRGQAEVMSYLNEMGIDPLVMQHAMVTPPDEIYLLVPEELETYKLVTALED